MDRKKHYVKLFFAVAAVTILALASLGTALAAPRSVDAAKQGLFGAVAAKSAASLTIEAKDGKQTVLTVTPDTKFRIPGADSASLADVEVGSRVAALASVQGDAWTALQVMVIPSRPTIEHATITVVEVQGNTIVGEDEDGNRLTIELPKPASLDLVGQLLTVVVKKDQSGTDTKVKAQASVSMKDVVERVKGHAAELRKSAGNEADAKRRDEREKELDKLTQRLEDDMKRHLDRFSDVIAKAPEQAQDALKNALENYRKGYEGALDALGKATPEAKERLNTIRASGTVASVDATAGKLTVNLPNGAQLSLTTDSSTKVSVGEEEATLADVSAGDPVDVAYRLKDMLAMRIVVRTEASVRGSIQSVDSDSLALTPADGSSLELAITPDTKIEVDHKAATVADLKVGMLVGVKYDLRSLQAIKIEGVTQMVADGTLKSISAADHTITITTDGGADVTVKVSTDTRITARGLVLTLLGLKPGARVKVVYQASTMQAVSVAVWTEVEKQERENRGVVAGLVTSVDAAQGAVSIQAANGAAVTLKVTSTTKIHLNGKEAKLGDLAAGMHVTASYDIDSKTAVEIKAAMRPAEKALLTIRGTITAVDAGAGAVTIQVAALPIASSASVTVKVTDDTKVTLDGKKASLSDLAVGQGALVQFYAQSKEAVKLEAFSKANIKGRAEQGAQGNASGAKDGDKPVRPALETPAPKQPQPITATPRPRQ